MFFDALYVMFRDNKIPYPGRSGNSMSGHPGRSGNSMSGHTLRRRERRRRH